MQTNSLNVEFRSEIGKSAGRRMRAAGKIPAVCYGGGSDPILLTVDPLLLLKALDPVKKTNTVIKLTVAGAPGGSQEILVMVRDHQKDALRGNLTHADFVRVALDKDVHATVPLILTGKAEGVKLGGILHQVIRNLAIACTPDKIPVKLEVEVTALGMGDSIHVSDLKFPAGVKALVDGGQTVCSVTAPKAEKVAEVVEAAPVEGVAAAAVGADGKPVAPAAGDKAAAGAKAPAAAGAKAPAAAGGEKKGK